jgi:AcrR family transcriptional regulator
MPRDAASSRARILAAAVGRLRHGGRDECTVESVSLSAKCAKGLVLYHFGSKDTLLNRAALEVRQDRWTRLGKALASGSSLDAWDALWREIVEQGRDGTAGAYLSVLNLGASDGTDQTFSAEVLAWLKRSGVGRPAPDAALAARAAVDGFSAALTSRVGEDELAVAFLALGLALVVAAEAEV